MKTETKNETKHTPGPWQVIGDGVFQDHIPVASLTDDQISRVATVRHINDGYDPENLLADRPAIALEAVANAKLIAAAPELLAACKTVVGFYRQFSRLSCDEQAIFDAVSSAIEKAEGK